MSVRFKYLQKVLRCICNPQKGVESWNYRALTLSKVKPAGETIDDVEKLGMITILLEKVVLEKKNYHKQVTRWYT